ncbi:hypothetical protein CRG98_027143 [Punica granatum]|uniref:Uncharacterized protein n=1 Tax=Punica granatum TaxID=22663 RepID=A0A2I0J880_PUNGR|nr:hypothetical protein CRG98_027143 [Punica granatum]
MDTYNEVFHLKMTRILVKVTSTRQSCSIKRLIHRVPGMGFVLTTLYFPFGFHTSIATGFAIGAVDPHSHSLTDFTDFPTSISSRTWAGPGANRRPWALEQRPGSIGPWERGRHEEVCGLHVSDLGWHKPAGHSYQVLVWWTTLR